MIRIRGLNAERRIKGTIAFEICVERKFLKSVFKTRFRLKRQFWYGEYADTDFFTPSCPHLHSEDQKYKLNVYTGDIYDAKNRKFNGMRVSDNELKKLWSDDKFYKFANEMRKIYSDKFPNSVLRDIPNFD
ncbi:MAG: hypothetical protein IJM91_04590 [Lachnospiraceae bacterium]|nr:hypothetical protein [Lachnospiraceae bacterium]